jgi:hypothetical protein
MPVKGSTQKTNRPRAKAGVIRRRLRSETTRQIAAAEGIAQNTVIRILSLPEVRQAIARTRTLIIARAAELAERLMQIALGKTKKGDRQALVDILRGIGVLTTKLEVDLGEQEERDYSNAKVEFFYKYARWPTMEEAKEFDETIPAKLLIKGQS